MASERRPKRIIRLERSGFRRWDDPHLPSRRNSSHGGAHNGNSHVSLLLCSLTYRCLIYRSLTPACTLRGKGAGLIYAPDITTIKCGKGGDSGGHCGGLCPHRLAEDLGDPHTWDYPGDGCGGSWAPSDFGVYLHRQATWQIAYRRLQYNEIIVDGDDATAQLPGSIEAFFYVAGGQAEWQAREQYRRFRDAYPSLSPGDVPLVEFDLSDWENPFRAG